MIFENLASTIDKQQSRYLRTFTAKIAKNCQLTYILWILIAKSTDNLDNLEKN